MSRVVSKSLELNIIKGLSDKFRLATQSFKSETCKQNIRSPVSHLFHNTMLNVYLIYRNLNMSTINYKTPCNVVFNLKSPLGDETPNQTILAPLLFVLRQRSINTFINCEPISKVKQRIFSYKELVTFVNI